MKNGNVKVYIGNKHITTLVPQYFKIASHCPKTFVIQTNNTKKSYNITSEFDVMDDFMIEKMQDIRVNVIGYSSSSADESNQQIRYNALNKHYSIDKAGKIYRVEFYADDAFCSMSLVRFK
jgi:hypothetical protein